MSPAPFAFKIRGRYRHLLSPHSARGRTFQGDCVQPSVHAKRCARKEGRESVLHACQLLGDHRLLPNLVVAVDGVVTIIGAAAYVNAFRRCDFRCNEVSHSPGGEL